MSEKFNYKSPLAPYMKEFVGLKTSSGVSALSGQSGYCWK